MIPEFEDYARTNPHDALTVVAINDPNDGSHEPVMVASTKQTQRDSKRSETIRAPR